VETQAQITTTSNEGEITKVSKFASGIVPIIVLGSMIGSMIVFGVLNWNKLNVTADALKAIEERVTRQYSSQRAVEDKMRAEIDVLKAWMEYRKGYDQAIKDAKKRWRIKHT
jgi:hypothetical protein